MQQEYHTDEISNTDTLEAISELEENGGVFITGSAREFFKMLTESDD